MRDLTGIKKIRTFSFTALAIISVVLSMLLLASCSSSSFAPSLQRQSVEVKVASLKGPTSIGLVDFIHGVSTNEADVENDYKFTIVGTVDEILPSLIRGDIDIALLPANSAATLYNKAEGDVQVLNINTLGVLYAVSSDGSVSSIVDLAGRTVLMTGKGTTPEYVMNTLLDAAGIADQVTLEFKSEATELAAAVVADPTAIAILPEPYVTSVLEKDLSLKRCIDLTQAWKAELGEDLVTGVTVVRTQFAEDHPAIVTEFMAAQEVSVESVNAEPAAAAEYVVEVGILDNEQIAAKSIPNCNLVCIMQPDMQLALTNYLTALFAQNPSSIGGSVPGDGFYYEGA